MSREELRAELQKCIDANEIDHGMLYWQCSRGTTYRGTSVSTCFRKTKSDDFTVPCDLIPFDKTFRLISMEDTRFLHCNIKTLNLIPSVIAYQRCIEQGCQKRSSTAANASPNAPTAISFNHQGRRSLHPHRR